VPNCSGKISVTLPALAVSVAVCAELTADAVAEKLAVVDPAVKLPSDSTAKITSDGLLGGSHIAIEPGGAPDNLKPGGEIENTQGAVDLFGLIGQVIRPATPASPAASGAPAPTPAATPAPAAP